MDRESFLDAYARHLIAEGWDENAPELVGRICNARLAMQGHPASSWVAEGEAEEAAWREIGGQGPVSMRALRLLPALPGPEHPQSALQRVWTAEHVPNECQRTRLEALRHPQAMAAAAVDVVATVDGPKTQLVIPGAERSAHQAREYRDQAHGGRVRKGPNRPLDFGLFGDPPQRQLFDAS